MLARLPAFNSAVTNAIVYGLPMTSKILVNYSVMVSFALLTWTSLSLCLYRTLMKSFWFSITSVARFTSSYSSCWHFLAGTVSLCRFSSAFSVLFCLTISCCWCSISCNRTCSCLILVSAEPKWLTSCLLYIRFTWLLAKSSCGLLDRSFLISDLFND